MKRCYVEEVSHTADLALRIRATYLAGIYECAALGMFDLITGGRRTQIVCRRETSIQIDSIDPESLLVDWLTTLLLEYEQRHEVVVRLTVEEVTSTSLRARICWGELPDEPFEDIKAVTYHDLNICQLADGHWMATVVFDV